MLLNNHNTQLERDRANRKRQEARARKRTQRMETDEKIQVVQDEIQQLTQTNKGLATRKKELQEIKKNLQESAGIKQSPRKKTGSRVVMCRLWPEARSRAKPSQKKPGQAGPNLWPEPAFGPAWDLGKPKPLA